MKPERAGIVSIVLLVIFVSSCHRSKESVELVSHTPAEATYDVRFHSPSLKRALWYRIILPACDKKPLPALLFLHGANSSPNEVTSRTEIEKLAVDSCIAVVLPNGEFSYFTNARHKMHSRWEDAIASDLVSDVRRRFPNVSGPMGVAGISMGGYGAAKLSLKHPELFQFTSVMSGALDITRRPASLRRIGQTWRIWTIFGFQPKARRSEDIFYLLDNGSPRQTGRWFDSCGANDPLLDTNKRFVTRMRQRGIEVEYLETPGGHDWTSWNRALPQLFSDARVALH